MFNAGAAELDITPPVGTPLAGSFEERIAVDVDDPLFARAVVLEGGAGPAGRLAIVCCDLICMPGETVRATRDLVARSGEVPPERVLIASTHTHTAASPAGLLGTRRAGAYMDALPPRLATVVSLAARRLRPARAACGSGEAPGIAFNRRFRMRDGTVRMNPGRMNPDALEPVAPVDPEVSVLWIEAEDGAPLAVIASFALHYVGTDHSRHVSADYFGAFARWLRRCFGPDVVPILLNGASGDINNVDVRDPHQPSGRRQAERVAGIVAGETLKVAGRLRPVGDVSLAAAGARLPFRRKTVTAEDLATAERILSLPESVPGQEIRQRCGIGPAGPFSWVTGQPLPDSALRTYARECRLLAQLPEQLETEVLALRIGDCAVVALPGEIFVELGLAIKAASPFRGPMPDVARGRAYQPERVTLLSSLSGDYVGYVPTRRAIEREGGYETWAARSALPAAGTGEAMVELAAHLLAQVARS